MRDVPLREASVTCNYPMEICRGSTVGHTAWNGVSCHDIAGIWVAFFSGCQRYRCGQATRQIPATQSLDVRNGNPIPTEEEEPLW